MNVVRHIPGKNVNNCVAHKKCILCNYLPNIMLYIDVRLPAPRSSCSSSQRGLSVEPVAEATERVDHVHGVDRLSSGVARVCVRVLHEDPQERPHDVAHLLVRLSGNAKHASL